MAENDENLNPEDREIAKIAKQLLSNPKTRKEALRLIKQANPDKPVPEVDIEDAIAAKLKELDDKYEAKEKEERNRKATEKIESGRTLLKNKGFSEEEIKGIEARMTTQELPADYEKALKWVEKEREFAAPRNFEPDMDVLTMPKHEGLFENPAAWARKEAHSAVSDIIKSRGGRG